MADKELMKVVEFIEKYYRKLKIEEIKALKDELKNYNYQTFLEVIKPKLLANVKYFNIATIHQIIQENAEINEKLINWNSCYWYEIEKEYCEKSNIPYYDITTGKALNPYKTAI